MIKQMTPIQANLVLQHKIPPDRYEAEIYVKLEEDRAKALNKVGDDVSSAPVVESGDEAGSPIEPTDETRTNTSGGRLWYEVIEQPEGMDSFVVGLFLSEIEARACQKIYEELAKKKSSRSTFATKATRKA
jgi:hypothetical protein